MKFGTYLVTLIIFKRAVHVIFWAWHQNRSGILQVSTKSDYTELRKIIRQLFPNFTQSSVHLKYFWYISLSTSSSILSIFVFCQNIITLYRITLCRKKGYLDPIEAINPSNNDLTKFCSFVHPLSETFVKSWIENK